MDWVRWGGMGFVSAAVALPLLGSTGATGLQIGGFLALGLSLGLVGGAISCILPSSSITRERDWLAMFAWVTVACAVPLIIIGGLVTSTNSGMAVPDWPTTFGSNMFLYPLRAETDPKVFFEHSHRLFGTLIGMASVILVFWTVAKEKRRAAVILAVIALLLVVAQGVLGGMRVRMGNADPSRDLRMLAVLHGILAQITVGTLVALAVTLTPTFKHARSESAGRFSLPRAKLLRIASTGALHASILQLILGALYRHLRSPHVLYTHIAIALAVLVFALLAGAAASATQGDAPLARALRRCGGWILALVLVQFTLGWVAFLMGGSGLSAQDPTQALLRTAHQANGAFLLAFIVSLFLWTKLALRIAPPPSPAALAA
jgi:cytochrome c oxidase assembly protein subunit 15